MADDLNRDGAEKRFKGAAHEAEGKFRDKVGGLSGDKSEQLRGKAEEARGKIERKIGEAENNVDD